MGVEAVSNKIERAYESAYKAYEAIHAALSYGVEAALEDCDYDDALMYAKMMKGIEEELHGISVGASYLNPL